MFMDCPMSVFLDRHVEKKKLAYSLQLALH